MVKVWTLESDYLCLNPDSVSNSWVIWEKTLFPSGLSVSASPYMYKWANSSAST